MQAVQFAKNGVEKEVRGELGWTRTTLLYQEKGTGPFSQ